MYDLHTHSILSDGEMLPIELIRRMAVIGYTTVAITDHADPSNVHRLLQPLPRCGNLHSFIGVKLLCGVEITHVPPEQIAESCQTLKRCRGRYRRCPRGNTG